MVWFSFVMRCIHLSGINAVVRMVNAIAPPENAAVVVTIAYIIFIILIELRRMRKKNMTASKCSTIMYASILNYTQQSYYALLKMNGAS